MITDSSAGTAALGRRIGRRLASGDVVALKGALGSGKTTLAKGIAEGLGVDGARVSSPTFTLVHEYEGREKIFHMDWYRLKKVEGADEELALECFGRPAVTLVEWAEKAPGLFPERHLEICLSHAGPNKRKVLIKKHGGFQDVTAGD
ncbi:MAG: tRNA (adenosine(37)-N6)-threonylcarbamoyltransferase complex ATPase subunit type 1 TsaE [Omnitrophica bacterium RIFCSPHIGHO2_02_FULL_63_14]|nr:MAG: tRNA (adenosine(37)-N6)-threonylcarbamoyltransferase complex ATPase subunit type 1 TsaE [Omnitrophica bacterium RIFCSPHIGHO2_02_FULL_63_14]